MARLDILKSNVGSTWKVIKRLQRKTSSRLIPHPQTLSKVNKCLFLQRILIQIFKLLLWLYFLFWCIKSCLVISTFSLACPDAFGFDNTDIHDGEFGDVDHVSQLSTKVALYLLINSSNRWKEVEFWWDRVFV